ncbi:MAG: hypothetical protein R2828_18435 [Saprospiraceae bacterium]
MQSSRAEKIASGKPFRPSWMDFLVDRIKRLPGPSWAFYLLLFICSVLVSNVVLWLDGALAVGTFNRQFSYGSIFIIYGLCFYQFLAWTVAEALHDFYPFLEADPKFEDELKYRMTRLPAAWGWTALIVGIALTLLDVFSSQYDFGINSPVAWTYGAIFGAFGYCTFLGMMFQTCRQLFFVIQLHSKIAGLDLFNLRPLRAFSRFTATAGFAVFFIGVYNVLIFSENSSGSLITFYLLLALVGILLFIAPLISISTRINKEKKERIFEVDQHLKRTLLQIRENVNNGDLTKMGDFNTTLGVLEKEKSILKGISSFPWNPNAFRTFLSTIILPLLLWWIRTILEKWL